MTITAIGVHHYPNFLAWGGHTGGATQVMDSINDRFVLVFQIPATGTLQTIHWRMSSVATAHSTSRLR